MEIRKGRHVVYSLHAHLVFVTKKRGKIFNHERLQFVKEVMERVCNDLDVDIQEFNGCDDHIHLLVNYPPKIKLSELVNTLKGVSSRMIKKEYPELKQFWSIIKSRDALWSPSYFAGSVGGATLEVLKKYIENQQK